MALLAQNCDTSRIPILSKTFDGVEGAAAPSDNDHSFRASASNVFRGRRGLGCTCHVSFERTGRIGCYVDLAGGYLSFKGVNS